MISFKNINSHFLQQQVLFLSVASFLACFISTLREIVQEKIHLRN